MDVQNSASTWPAEMPAFPAVQTGLQSLLRPRRLSYPCCSQTTHEIAAQKRPCHHPGQAKQKKRGTSRPPVCLGWRATKPATLGWTGRWTGAICRAPSSCTRPSILSTLFWRGRTEQNKVQNNWTVDLRRALRITRVSLSLPSSLPVRQAKERKKGKAQLFSSRHRPERGHVLDACVSHLTP